MAKTKSPSPKSRKPKSPKRAKAATAAEGEDAPRKLSGLDAAVLVLKAAGSPMRVPDITKSAIDSGHWAPGGKTPAATLNAAIIREIKVKGSAARFSKTGRGLFALSGA